MPAVDPYAKYISHIGSARRVKVITPDDNNDLPFVTRGVIVATAGNLAVTSSGGDDEVIPLPAGQFSLSLRRIKSTGTTATGITILGD